MHARLLDWEREMARKKATDRLTPLELELMKVLWETGPATVQMVQQKLPQQRELAYTTVQTMLNVLYRKGKVKRRLRKRAYYYHPVMRRPAAIRQAVDDLLERLFGGSAESLVMNLVETRRITPEKLASLNAMIDKSGRADDGRG